MLPSFNVFLLDAAVIVTDTDKAETSGDIATPLHAGVISKPAHVRCTLGALLSGAASTEPALPTQDITLFKSVGIAFQDIATAHAAVVAAERGGHGCVVDMTTGAVVGEAVIP